MATLSGPGTNRSAVAQAFDTAFNAGPGLNGMPGLYGVSSGQLPQALSTLSGDSAGVAQSAALSAGNQFASLMTDRVVTRRNEELACYDHPADAQACQTPPDWSAWSAGFGEHAVAQYQRRHRRGGVAADSGRQGLRHRLSRRAEHLVGVAVGAST